MESVVRLPPRGLNVGVTPGASTITLTMSRRELGRSSSSRVSRVTWRSGSAVSTIGVASAETATVADCSPTCSEKFCAVLWLVITATLAVAVRKPGFAAVRRYRPGGTALKTYAPEAEVTTVREISVSKLVNVSAQPSTVAEVGSATEPSTWPVVYCACAAKLRLKKSRAKRRFLNMGYGPMLTDAIYRPVSFE